MRVEFLVVAWIWTRLADSPIECGRTGEIVTREQTSEDAAKVVQQQ